MYWNVARRELSKARALHVYMDGASIAKTPTEVLFVWSPELRNGCYAPPLAPASATIRFSVENLANALMCLAMLGHVMIEILGSEDSG